MRWRLAAVAVALAGAACAPKTPPPLAPDTAAALATVPGALDAAETAMKKCPQPGTGARTQIAIDAARAEWRLATHGVQDQIVLLQANLEQIRTAVALCVGIVHAMWDYHQRCHGDVRLGMTPAEVKQTAWCEPTKIVTTESARPMREEWIYSPENHVEGLDRPIGFLFFTGGKLISIQRSSR